MIPMINPNAAPVSPLSKRCSRDVFRDFMGLLTPPSAGTGMLLNILAAAEVVFGASMNVAVV